VEQRLYCLAQDIAHRNPHKHIRMLELVWSLVHEIAHLFISHLNFMIHGNSVLPRLGSPDDQANEDGDGEAGYTFERALFGGVFYRELDGSDRDYAFRVRLRPVICFWTMAC
jgi:hypothetical protein